MADLTGYSLVLACTEEGLNNSFEYAGFWKVPINYQISSGSTDDSDTPPPPAPGFVDVRMAAPHLRLHGDNPTAGETRSLSGNEAVVVLSFQSGTLQYYDMMGQLLSEDLSGWSVTFVSSIASSAMSEEADAGSLPVSVQQALSNPALSVGQLFLEISSGAWTGAIVTDADGAQVTDFSVTNALGYTLNAWSKSIESAEQQWVMNYVVTHSGQASGGGGQESSAQAVPELVPTSYDFSITRYNPAGDYDCLSTLNYLMMTQGDSAPTADSAGVFDDNWVSGPNTQEYQGTVAVDADLFNQAYVRKELLPAIAKAIGATKPQYSDEGNGTWSILQSVDKDGDQNDGKGQKKEGLGVQELYEDDVEEVSCTVTLDPASASYLVDGHFKATAKYTLEFVGWDKTDSKFSDEYILYWSFSIQLKAAADGTIALESADFNQGNPQTIPSGQNFGGDIASAIAQVSSIFFDTYSNQFEDQAASIAQSDYSEISGQLKTTMSDVSNSIVFPAGNRFAYKDVGFDETLNLIASVTFID